MRYRVHVLLTTKGIIEMDADSAEEAVSRVPTDFTDTLDMISSFDDTIIDVLDVSKEFWKSCKCCEGLKGGTCDACTET